MTTTYSNGRNFHNPHGDPSYPPKMAGAKSHIFLPPRTPPASTSSSLYQSHASNTVHRPSTTRKRTLEEYNDICTPEISLMAEDWDRDQSTWMPGSPKPFVNTRYQLAGGMDTPGMVDSRNEDDERNGFGEVGFRKSLSDMDEKKMSGDYFGLQREGNGRSRSFIVKEESNGWSSSAFSVMGAVVGKAWEFCKAGATVFTGFRAGGGQAYTNEYDSVARFETIESSWENEKSHYDFEMRVSTPLPGRFPGDDFSEVGHEDAMVDESPVRPTKRRQVSGGFRDEEIAKNWVVVQNPSGPQVQTHQAPRPPLRSSNSNVSRQSLLSARRSTSRTSILPASRPTSRASIAPISNVRRTQPLSSHAGSHSLSPNRGASFASPRSPASRIPRASVRDVSARDASRSPRPQQQQQQQAKQESPAAREAKKWKVQKMREEREADESIRRLDAQLKAMIREGREALGTRVEVLDDGDGEW